MTGGFQTVLAASDEERRDLFVGGSAVSGHPAAVAMDIAPTIYGHAHL
jgi:hypothetical protein